MHLILTAPSRHDPRALVAIRSFRRHHPDHRVTVVVTDPRSPIEPCDDADETFTLRATRVGPYRYTDVWLAGGPSFAIWAALPTLPERFSGNGPLLVLPHTSWVLAPLHDIGDEISATSIALLPRRWNDVARLATAGWIDGVAVFGSEAADSSAAWLDDAIRTLSSTSSASRLGDPWGSWQCAGPGLVALHDPTLRMSPWSVDQLGDTAAPVRLAQFPAFNPSAPWWYTGSEDSKPTVLVSEHPPLRDLCRAYAAEFGERTNVRSDTGDVQADAGDERWVLPGLPIVDAVRSSFHAALIDATDSSPGSPRPANPLEPDEAAAFLA